MNTYFIGCLHLGHEWMAKHRGFQDSFYHDEWLITEWNSVVTKRDIVYILGDITMETPGPYYQLDRMNGRKRVILGNHDRPKDIPLLLEYVEEVSGPLRYKGYLLSHIPIHPNETSFYGQNIHAHIHHENKLEEVFVQDHYGDTDKKQWPTLHRYICVDAKLLNYRPKTIEQLKQLQDD